MKHNYVQLWRKREIGRKMQIVAILRWKLHWMSITWVVIFILCYFRGIHNWYLDEVSACSLYKELIWSNKFQKYANYLWQYSLRYSISCYKGWSGQLDKDNWCFSLKLYINRWCQNIPREHTVDSGPAL